MNARTIEVGTKVVAAGYTSPEAYGGAERHGKPIEDGRVLLVVSVGSGATYVGQPRMFAPASALEAIDRKDERIQVSKVGRDWVPFAHLPEGIRVGREWGTKRDALLWARTVLAIHDWHAAGEVEPEPEPETETETETREDAAERLASYWATHLATMDDVERLRDGLAECIETLARYEAGALDYLGEMQDALAERFAA